jgi:hypothetical protein
MNVTILGYERVMPRSVREKSKTEGPPQIEP